MSLAPFPEVDQRLPAGAEEPAPAPILRKVFSFPAFLGAFLVTAMYFALRFFILDPDVWWHIKVGETILKTHHVPTTDPYSFTVHGAPWIAYEWLGDVLLAAAHHAAGPQGLLAVGVAAGSATLLGLYVLCTERSGNSKAAFLACILLLGLVIASFSLRPQMFGYFFLVITLIALERFGQGKPGMLWLLPPMFLLWVNIHGSFIIGLGTIGVYWASGLVEFHSGSLVARRWTPAERRRLELVFLLCLIALTITPYGTRLAAYPFSMVFSQPLNVGNVIEWKALPFNLWFGKLFLVLIFGFLLAQITLRPAWRLAEFALALAGIAMASLHTRFLLVFVPCFAPLLATLLARGVPPYQAAKDPHALNAVLMALAGIGVVVFFPSRAALGRAISNHYPVESARYLRLHPVPGPMYNQYGFGGYLVYALGPQEKVFIDGRGDLYERGGVMAGYLRISQIEPEALALLRGYGIKSCLLERDEPLVTLLAASGGWQQVYADKLSVLFVRKR